MGITPSEYLLRELRRRRVAAGLTQVELGKLCFCSDTHKMVLERLDAELSETDDQGRLLTFGKVATVAVVGNEDGAHHVTAEVLQALTDVGFTIPAAASTYWVGEAMGGVDYQDAGPKPDTTGKATKTLATNAAHLAHLLADQPYPAS